MHVDAQRVDLANAEVQAVLILASHANDIALHKSVRVAHFANGAHINCIVVLSGVRLQMQLEILLVGLLLPFDEFAEPLVIGEFFVDVSADLT